MFVLHFIYTYFFLGEPYFMFASATSKNTQTNRRREVFNHIRSYFLEQQKMKYYLDLIIMHGALKDLAFLQRDNSSETWQHS